MVLSSEPTAPPADETAAAAACEVDDEALSNELSALSALCLWWGCKCLVTSVDGVEDVDWPPGCVAALSSEAKLGWLD